jgi:hypothetical protein
MRKKYFDMDRIRDKRAGTPVQQIKAVWGLGRQSAHCDMTLTISDSTLMNIDAPEVFPAGSMRRKEFVCDDGTIAFWRVETNQPREGGPWK